VRAPRPEIVDFVGARFPGARLEPLAGDASARRFFRVTGTGGPSLVLMDYGEPFSGDTEDVLLSRLFETARLPVAHVEEVAGAAGCVVLEDLGDRMLEQAVAGASSPEEATDLLRRASHLAARIAREGTPVLRESARADGPALDSARFRFEMDFFVENFAGRHLRRGCPSELLDELYRLADAAATSSPQLLCHRDFHSRNLMVRDDGSLAMVDIQDARWGPDTYDLASLLRDAYLDIRDSAVDALVDDYLAVLPDSPPREAFRRRFDLVSSQRMIKALGTFGFQIAVRGNERYRTAVSRTVHRLREVLPSVGETRGLSSMLDREGLLTDQG